MVAENDREDSEGVRTGYGRGEADTGEDDARSAGAEGSSPVSDGGTELRCELCGGRVLDRHCKRVCLNCGYQRDCSDP